MKLASFGEFGLIRRLRRNFPSRSGGVIAGIGDDAAALRTDKAFLLLATTDMLLEGVHFDLSYTDLYSLGWKSAAVNLSDIAAMGGRPRHCLTALGIPVSIGVEKIEDFYKGLKHMLSRHKTELIGGDTCRAMSGLVVSLTMLGEVERRRILLRSGARPGDAIFVTGALGDSAAGLEILRSRAEGRGPRSAVRGSGRRSRSPIPLMYGREEKKLILKHLRPEPRVEWGREIAVSGCASSMIDLSDGLSSDLRHICEESGVGAELIYEQVPISKGLTAFSRAMGRSAMDYALSGGEDYELLFTVPRSRLDRLKAMRIPAFEIGEIVSRKGIYITDRTGKRTAVAPSGYDHFRR